MAQPFGNISEVWRRASLLQRVVLLGVVLGCVGGGVMLVNWARQPSLALLYSGLSPEEAANIVEKVRDAGVAYELRGGGTAVYVPEGQVYSLRLTMASAGLPAGGNVGYQILDQESFGASPFWERVRVGRAIEGEIARSIETLDSVVSARLHVVRPESSLLRAADKTASATVVVKLKGGYRLTSSNVAAIVHLVAGGVEGLTPGEVVVVDTQGNLLAGEGDDGINSRLASVLDQTRQIEEYLAKKAEAQLALVLGPNRSTVQVSVEMDTTSIQSETTTYGPDKGVVAKEMVKDTTSTEPATTKDGTNGKTTDSTVETEYKVTEKIERTIGLPGEIKSKTVAVVVDLSPPKTEGAEAAERKALALTDVEEIVKTALGLNVAEAGAPAAAGEATDKLTVKEASFYRPPEIAGMGSEDAGLFSQDFLLEIAKRFSLGLLVIGALLALRMFRGSTKAPAEAEGAAALEGAAGATAGLLPAGEASGEMLKAQITKALQDNPEEVKRLFLSWIDSGKGDA